MQYPLTTITVNRITEFPIINENENLPRSLTQASGISMQRTITAYIAFDVSSPNTVSIVDLSDSTSNVTCDIVNENCDAAIMMSVKILAFLPRVSSTISDYEKISNFKPAFISFITHIVVTTPLTVIRKLDMPQPPFL